MPHPATPASNRLLALLLSFALCASMLAACGGDSTPDRETTAPPAPTEAPPTAVPEPTPVPRLRRDILPTRLRVPSVGIDSPVGLSRVIPYVDMPLPGCPAHPEDTETLTVPNQGIVTPVEAMEGFENKAWIFGHSRWLGAPGILLKLQDINLGDEVVIEGTDRATGQALGEQRYTVDGIFISDTDSGDELIIARTEADIPSKPQVVLQTSVREDGPGKQWILDRQKLEAKARNVVQGDINDTCKYLLLFVVATAQS